jgi:2-haloacid dehalogenase
MSSPTIVFDLGGVLIDWNPRYLFCKMFNGCTEEMENFLENVCTLQWNSALDTEPSFDTAVADKIVEFPDYEPYITAYHSRWPEMIGGPILDSVAIFDDLRQAHFPTAALSNWPPETFQTVKQNLHFLNWFDEVILSSEVQMAKPDPQIYHVLLNRLGRRSQECVFIDDSIANIQSARQLGFQVIHFQSPNQLRSALSKLGIL